MEQYRWTSPEIDHQMLRDGGMSVVQASLANVGPLGCVGGGVDANGGPQYLCSHHSQSQQGCTAGVVYIYEILDINGWAGRGAHLSNVA